MPACVNARVRALELWEANMNGDDPCWLLLARASCCLVQQRIEKAGLLPKSAPKRSHVKKELTSETKAVTWLRAQ